MGAGVVLGLGGINVGSPCTKPSNDGVCGRVKEKSKRPRGGMERRGTREGELEERDGMGVIYFLITAH